MKPRGTTLIELLVALAVASLVATVALAALSMTGSAVLRHRALTRSGDAAWLALAALANDIRGADRWEGCVGGIACANAPSHTGPAALVLVRDDVRIAWFTDDGLLRCAPACERVVDDIVRAHFVADVPGDDGIVRRVPFAASHGGRATALEAQLWTRDGRLYRRTFGRPGHAR